MKFLVFLSLICISNSFNLCVVGGKSGLGRELVYQCISSNNKVLALTNNSYEINYPYRGVGLDKKNIDNVIKSNKLKVDIYDNFKKI